MTSSPTVLMLIVAGPRLRFGRRDCRVCRTYAYESDNRGTRRWSSRGHSRGSAGAILPRRRLFSLLLPMADGPDIFAKQYILTAAPTPLPPRVSQVMAEPILYHRAPAFVEIYARVLERLPRIFATENEIL